MFSFQRACVCARAYDCVLKLPVRSERSNAFFFFSFMLSSWPALFFFVNVCFLQVDFERVFVLCCRKFSI